MKKIFKVVVGMVACASLAVGLGACSLLGEESSAPEQPIETISSVYLKYEEEEAFTSAQMLDDLKGYTYSGTSYGRFYKLTKTTEEENRVVLLNADTGKKVSLNDMDTEDISRSWSIRSFSNISYGASYGASSIRSSILVATLTYRDYDNSSNDYTKSYFYDANGEKFAEINGSVSSGSNFEVYTLQGGKENVYYFELDGKTYYFNEKGMKIDYDPSAYLFTGTYGDRYNSNVSVIEFGVDGGYLVMESYGDFISRIVNYHASGNVRHILDLPAGAFFCDAYRFVDFCPIIAFDNGNYIVQYMTSLPHDAEKYDFLLDTAKCNLTTLLVDVTANTTTELNWKYLFWGWEESESRGPSIVTASDGEEWSWWNADDNMLGLAAYVRGFAEIAEDKRISVKDAYTWYAVYGDGTLKKAAPVINGVQVVSAEENAQGNLLVVDVSGRTYVVSKDGTILRELNAQAIEMSMSNFNEKYALIGKTLYDQGFNAVYTLQKGYSIDKWLDGEVVIKETIENEVEDTTEYKWYFLNGGTLTLIADSAKDEKVNYLDGVGVMIAKEKDEAGSFSYSCIYYNENGQRLNMAEDIVIANVICVDAEVNTLYCSYVRYDEDQKIKERSVLKLSKGVATEGWTAFY